MVFDPADPPTEVGPTLRIAWLLNAAAIIAGLLPTSSAGWVGVLFSAASAIAWVTAGGSRARRGSLNWTLAASIVVVLTISLWFVRPLPTPDQPLAQASKTLEQAWSAELDILESVGRDMPVVGGDYQWISDRRERLGKGAGVAILSRRTGEAVAWSGWTTPLSDEEWEALEAQLHGPSALIVLRRGLAVRLLSARVLDEDAGLIFTAECPLAREPAIGRLGKQLSPGVEAFVRWEGFGEGIRGELGLAPASGDEATYWSMLPLFTRAAQASERITVGRATISLVPNELLAARREQSRRRAMAVVAAVLLTAVALADPRRLWLLILAARLVLLLAAPLSPAGEWGLDGLTLVGLAATPKLPSGRGLRRILAALGLAATLAGLAACWWMTMRAQLAPGEILLGGSNLPQRVLSLAALVCIPWAGMVLGLRTQRLSSTWALAAGGAVAGLLTGVVHTATLRPALRARIEESLLPEIEGRTLLWQDALLETLEIAVPSAGQDVLARERDAVDLWWNSPLGHLGLASGVWKYDARGQLEDLFLTGLPPVEPGTLLGGFDEDVVSPFPRRFLEPEIITQEFLESRVQLMVAESRRPEGGAWVAALLVEPGNIPSRHLNDPLRGARRRQSNPPDNLLSVAPHLAWFDTSGKLIASELEAGPAPPLAPEGPYRWRELSIDGRPVDQIEIRDQSGTITAVFFTPDLLEKSAITLSWCLLVIAVALVLRTLAAFQKNPRLAATTFSHWFRQVGTHFRIQLAVALVLAGLIPLMALAAAGQAAARRQGRHQMESAASLSLHTATRLVEDMEALNVATGDADRIAAWLARTLGDDLFIWRKGEILATSRPDLVRAGLWPRRLPGASYLALTQDRQAMVVETIDISSAASSQPIAVVHGSYGESTGTKGILSISLSRAGRLLEQNLSDVDRALLVSVALLLGLTAVLLVPATGRLVRPLARLKEATANIAEGHFDASIPETGYEETRALARAFQAMAHSLKEQQESLVQRRAAIERIIESIPVAVIAISAAREIWATNPRAEELLAARAGDTLVTGGSELSVTVDRALSGVGELVQTIECTIDEQSRHFRVSGLDLPALSKNQPMRLILVEELTDTIRSERLTAWAEMARRIAHEIKNPLTPISLVVEHIRALAKREDPRTSETLDRALATISEQVAVLKETSREFGDYARLIHALKRPLLLPEQIRNWLGAYLLAPPKGIHIELVGPDTMPAIEADPRLLRRALINLVDNALAAVEQGGEIRITWRSHDKNSVEITVQDDGPGIAREQIPHLFEPDVTTRETGSGLGLPIARQAVEAHGGTIEVASTPGQGSMFTIRIPLD